MQLKKESALQCLKDKVVRIVLLSGDDQRRDQTAELLHEVDTTVKTSRLFKMTQLQGSQPGENGLNDRSVIESTLRTVSLRPAHQESTSSFKTNRSHDSAYSAERSVLQRTESQSRFQNGTKLLDFQEYLINEIRDVSDFRRFLGHLKKAILKKVKQRCKPKQQAPADKQDQERKKNSFVSDNFFVPKDKRALRTKTQPQSLNDVAQFMQSSRTPFQQT